MSWCYGSSPKTDFLKIIRSLIDMCLSQTKGILEDVIANNSTAFNDQCPKVIPDCLCQSRLQDCP